MAVSRGFALLMLASILCSAVAQSPFASPAPSPSVVANKPPAHSPSASPIPSANAPTKHSPSASPPSPVVKPPRRAPVSASPFIAFPPSAPQPSPSGAVANRLGFAAAAVGFFAVALMA